MIQVRTCDLERMGEAGFCLSGPRPALHKVHVAVDLDSVDIIIPRLLMSSKVRWSCGYFSSQNGELSLQNIGRFGS